jgi:hypothetical protein
MHEAMVYYINLQPPTGEMLAFFLIHGVCCVVEELCARRWTAREWPPPPRPLATLLVVVFVAVTAFWLFFPPLCRNGRGRHAAAGVDRGGGVLGQRWSKAAPICLAVQFNWESYISVYGHGTTIIQFESSNPSVMFIFRACCDGLKCRYTRFFLEKITHFKC